jgi:hypothetical protein
VKVEVYHSSSVIRGIRMAWQRNRLNMILPKNVLSNVSLRNFVLQVFAISLFLYIKCKSIRELILVTNCIYCFLWAFGDNSLVVNHLFISWNLLALLAKFVGLRLVIILLVSSNYFSVVINYFWQIIYVE